MFRNYSSANKPSVSSQQLPKHEVPHVTVIRPTKGLEPQLYECLASTFYQDYPRDKLTIYLCVSTRDDAAYPTLLRLLTDFPEHDARIFVEDEDPNLNNGSSDNLGPNPKIRNMSRAYREAKGDLVWIIDCNIWVSSGVCGRLVDNLCGYRPDGKRAKPYKMVHQLPLVVDGVGASTGEEKRGELGPDGHSVSAEANGSAKQPLLSLTKPLPILAPQTFLEKWGGRLEEIFISGEHAKFYTAINTVAVAPCLVGKSNMFRRSHLDSLTSSHPVYASGIDYFSHNICEDHLIGDLLWKNKVPSAVPDQAGREKKAKFGNHKLVTGDLAIQPMARTSLAQYWGRRVRWLRVRKWTVTLATLVEPGVESLLCSAYAAFALTSLPLFNSVLGTSRSWSAFGLYWAIGVSAWCVLDWTVFNFLHSMASVQLDEHTPSFARRPVGGRRRGFVEWLGAWIGREVLALPIWCTACLLGGTVEWRGRKFYVGCDMLVHEVTDGTSGSDTPKRALQDGLPKHAFGNGKFMEGDRIPKRRRRS